MHTLVAKAGRIFENWPVDNEACNQYLRLDVLFKLRLTYSIWSDNNKIFQYK